MDNLTIRGVQYYQYIYVHLHERVDGQLFYLMHTKWVCGKVDLQFITFVDIFYQSVRHLTQFFLPYRPAGS